MLPEPGGALRRGCGALSLWLLGLLLLGYLGVLGLVYIVTPPDTRELPVPGRPAEYIELQVSGDQGWLTPRQTISLHHVRRGGWLESDARTVLTAFRRYAGHDGPLLHLADFTCRWRSADELVISAPGLHPITVQPSTGRVLGAPTRP